LQYEKHTAGGDELFLYKQTASLAHLVTQIMREVCRCPAKELHTDSQDLRIAGSMDN
jgi:hypothetical protein